MGFIQINEDFIFIEPLNHTLAVTGHAHRVYRRKRSVEEKITEKPTSQNQYCGVVTGNTQILLNRLNVVNMYLRSAGSSQKPTKAYLIIFIVETYCQLQGGILRLQFHLLKGGIFCCGIDKYNDPLDLKVENLGPFYFSLTTATNLLAQSIVLVLLSWYCWFTYYVQCLYLPFSFRT